MESDKGLAIFKGTNKSFTSLKTDTIEEQKKLFNARKQCDVMIKDIKGQVIEVKDYFFAEYEKKELDDNGNPRIGHTTILFDVDGKTYVTTSNYFFNTFAEILSYTNGKIETPIKIKIVGKATNGKGEALSCEWL